MIRRWAWNARQEVRQLTRRALDRLDPPEPTVPATPPDEPAPGPVAAPPRPEVLQVEVESTPNPLALRLGLSRALVDPAPDGSLARALRGVDGVADVFLGEGFVTVMRQPDADESTVRDATVALLLQQG